jgi:hypothetical protein
MKPEIRFSHFIKQLRIYFCVFIFFAAVSDGVGQVNISAGNTITENFTIGTNSIATLPTGWKADKNATVRTLGTYSSAVTETEQRAGNSMSSTAANGIYNYAAGDPISATDRAVGGLSSASASKSVNIYVQLTNSGSTSISDFAISYDVEKYRNGSNAAGFSIQMYYSTDGSSWTSAGNDFLTSFSADADNNGFASAPGTTVSVSNKTLSVSLAASSSLYLAWNYSVTSGTTTSNAQGLGIDNVSITANVNSNPSITLSSNVLSGFSYSQGSGPSSEQSFIISGSNLTADISITPPTNYEISSGTGGSFVATNPITLTQSGGNISNTTIYVRLKAGLPAGTYNSESITATTTGATTQYVTCQGNVTTSLCVEQGFDNGTSAPVDWTFTGISETYSTTSNFGVSSPSLRFDNTGDQIETEYFSDATELSFWIKGQSTDANSALLIEGWSGSSWQTVHNITNSIPTTGSVFTYNSTSTPPLAGGFTRFRFTYTKSSGNLAFDDVSVYCNSVCSTPTMHASAVSIQSFSTTEVSFQWTNGDGAQRIVVMSAGNDINSMPVDQTTYTANTAFGSGSEIGTGNFVVFKGSGNSVNVTNLTPGTVYYVKVFEFACSAGNELYYTSGTPGNTNFFTTPSVPTAFASGCIGSNDIDLSWSAPASGVLDGYLLVAREISGEHSVNSIDPATSNFNLNYSLADEFGTTTPYSRVLYLGNNNSATITGLTLGVTYTFRVYSYKTVGTETKFSNSTSLTRTIQFNNVTNANASGANNGAFVSWVNPDSPCFDEVMVVVNTTSGISFMPIGDGSAYSANPNYSGVNSIVYKGGPGSSFVNVTGLNNGVTYYFEIFVRKGTSWSSGVEVSAVPANVTVLEGGDIAIIAVNTQYAASGSDDEICLISFKDIKPGTAIEFTDNGYERIFPFLWGDTEGTIRIIFNGSSNIPKGTPICLRGSGYQTANFSIIVCGIDQTADWMVLSLNGNHSFDLNKNDQVWIFQNGSWVNPSGDHNASYTGSIVWGWTGTGWKTAPGYNSTEGSTLPPGSECYNTEIINTSYGKTKYTGPLTSATQINWIGRINTPSNWTDYTDNSSYNSGSTTDYSGSCIVFDILSGGFTEGKWTGAKNADWFDCANWENLKVPDQNINVVISSSIDFPNEPVIGEPPMVPIPYSTASCKNLTIESSKTLTMNHPNSSLEIFGDLTQNGVFSTTNGIVKFFGSNSILNAIDPVGFINIEINKNLPSESLTLHQTIATSGTLTLTKGKIVTNSNSVIVQNILSSAIENHNPGSYIAGNLKRYVSSTGTYDFPVGSTNYYELASVSLNSSSGLDYIDAQFTTPISPVDITSLNIIVNNTLIEELLDYGYWTFTPSGGTYQYNITLTSRGHTNPGLTDSSHTVLKRINSSNDWTSEGIHNNNTQLKGPDWVRATRSNLNSFSDFTIAKSNLGTLPVELISFNAVLQNEDVLLDWTTASEVNNSHFEIERSVNSNKDFSTLGFIPGNGNTNTENNYHFTDFSAPGGILYYRLRQVDFDGKWEHVGTRVVVNTSENGALMIVSPVTDENTFSFDLINVKGNSVRIEMYHLTGELISSNVLPANEDAFRITMNAQGLKGVFLVRVTDGEETVTHKFFK